ncbi:MAG: hypothetical protein ACR2OO_11220, partial [Thermomicrobiales bacterium]
MDGQRFDALTRSLAFGASRRTLFKGAAAAIGAILAPLGRERTARAEGAYCGVTCADSGQNCDGATDRCYTCCDPLCVDTSTDPNNCGDCGRVCPGASYASCGDGVCGLACPDGWSPCGDGASRYCADLGADVYNCQSCRTACTPPRDACCPGVGCVWLAEDDGNCGACGNACGQDMRCCNGQCVDPSTDGQFCGSCEITCAADQICRRGICAARCPAGQILCGPDCVDPAADRANCGGCGAACAAGEVCQRGSCVSTCAAGATDCGGICANLTTDPNNCGACANVCSRETVCQNGVCVRPQPPGNTRNCPDGQTGCQDGCVDVKTDANHCGGCKNVCIGTISCCGGACVDLKTAAADCGACGRVCPPGWTCRDGGCEFTATETGVVSSRRVATPELCLVPARSTASLQALADGAAAATPTPQVSWAQIAKGTGVGPIPASALLVQAIQDAVAHLSACGNADDPARQTALMTDEMAGRFLRDRGLTGARLNDVLAVPAVPRPGQSWLEIGEITDVLNLGDGLASAVVTRPAPIADAPPWQEVQVYARREERWLLHTVLVMRFPADPGTIVLRGFECYGLTPQTFGTNLCHEAVFDGPWSLSLTSDDGKTTRFLAAPDARFPEDGVAAWDKLPPGGYTMDLSGLRRVGSRAIVFGAEQDRSDPLQLRIILSGRTPYEVVDVYKFNTGLSQAVGTFVDRVKTRHFCPTCPPCHVCDSGRAICVYTCPQCSACVTRIVQSTGEMISVCENGCSASQCICQHDRCCRPQGASCMHGSDCCNSYCVHGICSCIG